MLLPGPSTVRRETVAPDFMDSQGRLMQNQEEAGTKSDNVKGTVEALKDPGYFPS